MHALSCVEKRNGCGRSAVEPGSTDPSERFGGDRAVLLESTLPLSEGGCWSFSTSPQPQTVCSVGSSLATCCSTTFRYKRTLGEFCAHSIVAKSSRPCEG